MVRKFENVTGYEDIPLPKRSTEHSVGYDFVAAERVVIPAGQRRFVPTGVKATFPHTEGLFMYNRSSMPTKRDLFMSLGVGVIECDYYNNPDNEGHIFGVFTNTGPLTMIIEKGDKIMQGVFQEYKITDDDEAAGKRMGGFGSTDKIVDTMVRDLQKKAGVPDAI